MLACIAVIILLTAAAGRAAARPGDRRDHRQHAVHGQPDLPDHADLPGRRHLLRHGARKTVKTSVDVINAITKTFASLAGLIFMLLLISQFIAYFNYSNMPTVDRGEDGRRPRAGGHRRDLAADPVHPRDRAARHHHPGRRAEVGDLRAHLHPALLRLGVAPQTVLAAYRVGDSPMNVITPLMVYLPFIVVVAQRYKKDAGLGTIISLMIPYTLDHARRRGPSSSSSGT